MARVFFLKKIFLTFLTAHMGYANFGMHSCILHRHAVSFMELIAHRMASNALNVIQR